MNPIRIRLFTETGRRLPDVTLPISTTEASTRALRRIAKSEYSGLTGEHLAQIDAGRLEWSALRRMFTRPELRKAIESRLADVNMPRSEREQLLALLEQPSYWSAALGGEDAYDRFGTRRGSVPRGSHQDSYGGGASRGEETPEFRMAKGLAKDYGWRVSRSTAGGGLAMHHARRGGDELTIDTAGAWEHQKRGGATVAKGGAHELNRHLLMVHGLSD